MIRIDFKSFVPIFEQIKDQLRTGILQGRLGPGDPLPSIRDLAAEIVVNPNTVARAYRELEAEGLVSAHRGRGCFVEADVEAVFPRERTAAGEKVLDRAVREALILGIGREEIERLFRLSLDRVLMDRKGD